MEPITYTVTIEHWNGSEPICVATLDELPGLHVAARTREEAVEKAAIAALPLFGMLGVSHRRTRLQFKDVGAA